MAERDTCRPWLAAELNLLAPTLRVIMAPGAFGWQIPRPRPVFGHGAEVTLTRADRADELRLLGCFHVSQQNTFTGRLTPAMLEDVLVTAKDLAGLTD